MAKKGTTIRLSDDIWEEIEDYQNKNKLDNKNIAIERMLFERRILSNCMNTLNNLNITVSGLLLKFNKKLFAIKMIVKIEEQEQEERIKDNPDVQDAIDKCLEENNFRFNEE